MRGKLVSSHILSILFVFTIIISCTTLSVFAAQHFPSVKTYDRIPGSQYNLDWLANNYDWVDSATPPIDAWFTANPNIKIDNYGHWGIINFVGDYDTYAEPSLEAKWYNWCANNGTDWESGFFHLADSDTYLAQNLSSWGQEEDAKIRYILRNGSPTTIHSARTYRDNAWNGSASLSLATVGDSVYFGRLDRFDEINLAFSTWASYDWHGVWEYWNGSSWAALTITSDGTDDAQHDGQVRFFPPSTSLWKQTKVNGLPTYWGTKGVYYVRLRTTTAGSVGPVIRQAQGRHYWVHNGTSGNTVPAWDPANDTNGDGYRDTNVNSAATARFKHEARLPHFWAWVQYALNISNPTIRQKFPEFNVEVLDSFAVGGYRYQGVQLDDLQDCNIPVAARSKVIEYPGLNADQTEDAWIVDFATMLAQGRQILNNSGYLLGANVGWKSDATFETNLDYHMREDSTGAGGCNRPVTPGYWGNWEEYVWGPGASWSAQGDLGKPMLWQWQLNMYYRAGDYNKSVNLTQGSTMVTGNSTNWSGTVTPGSTMTASISGVDYGVEIASVNSNTSLTLAAPWPGPSASSQPHYITLERDKMLGLAAFLVMQKQSTDYFSTWYGYYYTSRKSPLFNWVPAATADYGVTTGAIPSGKASRGTRGAYVYQSGSDPSYPSHTYYVYARDYTKAFVLIRPKTGGGSYGSESAITVQLPEPMRRVDYWGNLGSLVSQITLRNAEGAIFLKESPSEAPASDDPALQLSQDYPDLAEVTPGTIITYSFVCTNSGEADTNNAVLTNNLPAELEYIPGSARQNGVLISPDPVSNNVLSVNIGTISPGENVSITLQARIK